MSLDALEELLFGKTAEAAETNENSPLLKALEVHVNPPDRQPGTLNAKWGDHPPEPVLHSTGVKREAQADRPDMLKRLFATMEGSSSAEKKLMAERFQEMGSKAVTSHSPMLQKHAHQTFAERVGRTVGPR